LKQSGEYLRVRVDFVWCPSNPDINKTIQFCSSSENGVCEAAVSQCQLLNPQPLPTNPVTCYGGAICSSWAWNLSSFTSDWVFVSGNDSSQNPAGNFVSPGIKFVSLTVTDSTPPAQGGPFACTNSYSVPVGATLPLPTWKEIPPTF
jgi:hypothetical protein